jgi:hypothetical protein
MKDRPNAWVKRCGLCPVFVGQFFYLHQKCSLPTHTQHTHMSTGHRQKLLANLQKIHGHRIQAHSQGRTATRTTITGGSCIIFHRSFSDTDALGTTIQNVKTASLPPTPRSVFTLPPESLELTGSDGHSVSQTEEAISKVRNIPPPVAFFSPKSA